MDKEHFDVIILGSGPGGYPAAITLARNGKKVALIERDTVGGTCLNRGCIPTKTLLKNAEVLQTIEKASDFGITVGPVAIHFDEMQKRKNVIVTNLRKSLEGLIQSNLITLIYGFGSFVNDKTISVTGQTPRLLTADNIIIATGSEPKEVSAFPFDEEVIFSSTGILDIPTLPKKIAIVGGGVIGCEFASLFRSLHTEVILIEALNRILPLECPTISQEMHRIFTKKGIRIETGKGVERIEKKENGVAVYLQGNSAIDADIALIAIGRSLNTDKIGLEKTTVQLDRGAIIVDDTMRTTVPHIWAIGDITMKSMYAHTASHQGIVAAENIIGKSTSMHYNAIPGVIFTHPEIGSVGLSLDQAKEKGYEDAIRAPYPIKALGKAQAAHELDGFAQFVIREKTGEIVGAQVVSAEASILIAEAAMAIANELTIECITDTVHAHPTISEVWMESAFLAQKSPLHFPPIKQN